MKYWGSICLFLFACFSPCIGGGSDITPSKHLYDRVGLPIRTTLSSNSTYYQPVSLDQISPWLISAVVAAEDKRFYTHNGVDIQAILRAMWQNAQSGNVVSGASTLTQQLTRAITPRPKTLWGKTREAWEALSLENRLTKEEILEDYFNFLEFGNLTQGIQAASEFYFNTSASQLSLSQAAFLAGLLKSPTYYNPLKHMSRALERRNYVLKQMRLNDFIDDEMYQLALQEELVVSAKKRLFEAPHFSYLLETLLPQSVLQVSTTLDLELQKQVEQIVSKQLSFLQQQHVTQAAVIVLDNASGEILSYVGSANFHDTKNAGQVDGVRALRQPGSALKPFVYALAFEKGKLNPGSLLADEDTFFEGGFRPRNYDETYHGQVSVRTALACSYNIPAVKAAEQVGTTALLEKLQHMGFLSLNKSADFYGLGLALGNGEVRLLELANAYATLARGGMFKPLVLARNPNVTIPGRSLQVLDEQTAYLITDILADNQARAAAFGLNSALSVPFKMAAKTGTSKDYKDNFALGYTSRWTVGVWVGNFDASSMQKVSGITGAGPILHDVAVETEKKYPSVPFELPKGVQYYTVCNQSGLLAGPYCEHTTQEVLVADNIPEVCSGKHKIQGHTLQIISPQEGDTFMVDTATARKAQQLKLSAYCTDKKCLWKIDNKALEDNECEAWWPLAKGKHTLHVTCSNQTRQLSFEVIE